MHSGCTFLKFMKVEKNYEKMKRTKGYFQDLIYVSLIGRRVIPQLEIGYDENCYTVDGIIHIGAGCPVFISAEDDDALFSAELYIVMHEIAHRIYTVSKEFGYACTGPIKPFAEYAARKVLHKSVRLVKDQDYEHLFKELRGHGYYLSMQSLQTTFHYVANSIEDGRIEGLLGSSKATFKKLAKAERLKSWCESPVENSVSVMDPSAMTETDKLNLMLNQVLYVSTSYRFQRGFTSSFSETKMFDDISVLVPSLKKAVSSRSCKPAMISAVEVSRKLFDYVLNASKERDPFEEFMRKLLALLAALDGDSKFTLLKSEEEKGDEDSQPLFADDDQTKPEKSEEKSDKDGKKSEDDGDDDDKSGGKSSDGDKSESDDDESGSGSSDGEGEKSDDESSDGESEESDGESSDGDESESGDSKSDNSSSDSGESGDDSSDGDSQSESSEDSSDGDDGSDGEKGADDADLQELKKAQKQASEAAASYSKAMHESAEEEDRIKEIMQNDKPYSPSKMDLDKVSSVYDYDVDFTEKVRPYKADDKTPLEIENKGASLRSQIEKILKTKPLPDKRGVRKGTIDGSRISRLIFSDTSVFKQRGEPKKMDACAFLLQDNSGSMRWNTREGGSRFDICCESFAVIEEGFRDIMPLKIAAFSAGGVTSVTHVVIKEFDEKAETNLSYNFKTHWSAGGGNKDGYSIRVATQQLLARHEENKILVIASDGAPTDYSRGEEEGALDTKNAVDEARRAGLTVIGIYIGDDEDEFDIYKEMYGDQSIMCSPYDLDSEVARILRVAIEKH